MKARLLLLSVMFFSACTASDEPASGRELGKGCPGGTVRGTLDTHPFAPVHAACARTEDSGVPRAGWLYSIVLASDYDACPIHGGGDQLAITFCGSTAPAVGTYANGTTFNCQTGNNPVISVLFADAGQQVVARAGGTVTITEEDGECVSGTYDIPFANGDEIDHLTGEFHALEPQ